MWGWGEVDGRTVRPSRATRLLLAAGATLLLAGPAVATATHHRTRARALPRPISATGDLSYGDLLGIAAEGLKPGRRDEFSGPPVNHYAGRLFRFRLQVGGPNSDQPATWSYSLDNKVISLQLTAESMELGDVIGGLERYAYISGVAIMNDYKVMGHAVGRNAFGVRVPYEYGRTLVVALGHYDDRESLPPGKGGQAALEPEDARREAAAMTAEISGVVDDAPIVCGLRQATATIDDPYEIATTTCAVPASIRSVVWHGVGDKVLATWVDVRATEVQEQPRPRTSPAVITDPVWLRGPNADDIARYYPDRAQRLEKEGRATISCTVSASGTLVNCAVVNEDPSDMEFGDAAMKMARLFKMAPTTTDGAPVEGAKVRIPIRFSLPN